MIVGLLNDSFPPIVDGVARVVVSYAQELTNLGDRAVAVVPELPGLVTDYPFEVYSFRSHGLPIPREYRWGLGALDRSFERTMRSIPFDIVHTHCPFSTHLVGREIAKRRRVPLVTTFHTKFRDDFMQVLKNDMLADFLVKWIVRMYDASDEVWTVNDASVEALREYGYKGDIVVMENGCDLTVGQPDPEKRKALLTEFHLPDAPMFTSVGRLVPQKNLHMLLDAALILKNSGEKFSFLLVGDGEEREALEKQISELNIGDCVRLAGAVRDREKLKNIYMAADAALLPSLYDTSSLVPREASACLCPTVFAAGSSTAQGIEDGVNGFLAEADAKNFADKLSLLMHNGSLRETAARGALETLYRPWSAAVGAARDRYLYLIDKKKLSVRRPFGRGAAFKG